MKKNVRSLLALAGSTAIAGSAMAQWSPVGSPFAGPYEVYPAVADTTFKSFDLGGEVCPAGTYGKATITSAWNRVTPSLQWPDDIRGALTDAAVSGTSVIPGTVYYGGVNGAKGTVAALNNTPGPCNWVDVTLTTPFMGAGPLHFAYRTNYNGGAAGITLSNIAITLLPPPPPPVCTFTDTEPNDSKATANEVTLANGEGICGSPVGSNDYYKIKTAAAPGIMRHRLNLRGTGTVATIRALSQTDGVITPGGDTELQATTATQAWLQWFSLGNSADANDRCVYVRAAGGTSDYDFGMVTTPVVPTEVEGGAFEPGSITITTVGQTGGTQTDTDFWVYDSNFNPIPEFGNDDEGPAGPSLGSRLIRTYAAGTYYIGMGRYNTANNMPSSAADEDYRVGPAMDFPGVVAHGTVTFTPPLNVSFQMTDSVGSRSVPATLQDAQDVAFFKFTVGTVGNGGCQPADIADDQGFPLPSANINSGVNEGDYNAFFAGFFDALSYCDQWDDAGNPLPSAGVNSGVNEGDYNGFFATFFNGCP